MQSTIMKVLLHMSSAQRAAFAAGCAARIFDLYLAKISQRSEVVEHAIARTWQRAEGAESPECVGPDAFGPAQWLSLEHEVIPRCTLLVALRAFEIAWPGKFSCDDATIAACDAMELGGCRALREEAAWQLDWLAFCAEADPREARKEYRRRVFKKPAWSVCWD